MSNEAAAEELERIAGLIRAGKIEAVAVCAVDHKGNSVEFMRFGNHMAQRIIGILNIMATRAANSYLDDEAEEVATYPEEDARIPSTIN